MSSMSRSLRAAALIAALAGSGCAYYFPHTLVATNIRSTSETETFVRGSARVETQVCGNRLFGIPFGPDPTMDAFIGGLEQQAAGAVGFEDIRVDRVFVNYLFVFWQDCVSGSAVPLLPPVRPRAAKRPPRPAPPVENAAPPPEEPAPAETPPAELSPKPAQPADPFAD
jgi:hypothetical protein